ncbi:MAG: cytochrome c3 family protein [Actinomycetota bacterium]
MSRLLKPILCLLLFAAVRLNAGEHPVPLEKNTDSAKCLECHDDKGKGAHVHTAISMGCTTCHEIKVVDKDTTNIDLIAPKEELCFTCHEKSTRATLHGPYKEGKCVLCHDPHTSPYEYQLRASGNALCLECHQNRHFTGKVALFKTDHELTEEEYAAIPKIWLDPTLTMGHPMGMHKVANMPDPTHPGKQISCLSCHENHASDRDSLVRTVEVNKKKMDACDACHLANDNAAMAAAQKRADELEAQREKEQQLQQKQPNVMPQRPPKEKIKKQ